MHNLEENIVSKRVFVGVIRSCRTRVGRIRGLSVGGKGKGSPSEER